MNLEYWVINVMMFSQPFVVLLCYYMYKDLKKKSKIIKLQDKVIEDVKGDKKISQKELSVLLHMWECVIKGTDNQNPQHRAVKMCMSDLEAVIRTKCD